MTGVLRIPQLASNRQPPMFSWCTKHGSQLLMATRVRYFPFRSSDDVATVARGDYISINIARIAIALIKMCDAAAALDPTH